MESPTPQEAKGTGAEQDPSMEEILQSIKKIIAEDGTEVTPANGAASSTSDEDVPGSDVLELTEMLPDETPTAATAASNDVLSQIDDAVGAEKTAPPAPVSPAAAPAAKPTTPASSAPSDPMLSESASAAAAASFNKLKRDDELPPVVTTPSPAFKSGTSVEDMVAAMLRPMIKEWLDTNLPAIVERIVDREVKRLTK
ncbi:MAG: DUF2497 domain-containing protein [Alphaproteobacteria bacterium]